MVKLLVKNFAQVDQQDEEGNTCLHLACSGMYAPLIIYLVEEASANGQTPNLKNKTPYAVLMMKCEQSGKQE